LTKIIFYWQNNLKIKIGSIFSVFIMHNLNVKMIKPLIRPNEASRLAALHNLQILDTPPEERFDRITRTAARFFGVPIALISLVDEHRQWFKSRQGIELSEIPCGSTFCERAILNDATLVIPDAHLDPLLADNPLVVGEPHTRFYAGRPLKALDGSRVGTLCLLSPEPRQMSALELEALDDLADMVEAELNQVQQNRKLVSLQQHKETWLQTVLDNVVDGIMTISDEGIIYSLNRAGERIFGYSEEEVIGHNIRLLMPEFYHSKYERYLINPGSAEIAGVGREIVGRRKDGTTFPLDFAISQTSLVTKFFLPVCAGTLANANKSRKTCKLSASSPTA
jgi:PAS domain S-box-containing protein